MKNSDVIFRCGEQEKRLTLSVRDAHLLDGEYFLIEDVPYRPLFGLDFVRGLGAPPLDTVLKEHRRAPLVGGLEALLNALEDQKDLITYSYKFEFSERRGWGSGGMSGFEVGGLHGFITTRPSGYCHVTLSERAPTGRGRIVQIIDMRVKKQIKTDNWGLLKTARRKAKVGWFDQLPSVISWLKAQKTAEVQVLHG